MDDRRVDATKATAELVVVTSATTYTLAADTVSDISK